VGTSTTSCSYCGLEISIDTLSQAITYNYRKIFASLNWSRFIKWSLLQNNGLVAYAQLTEASCSSTENSASLRFADFIASQHLSANQVLDIGCGSLPRPSYLEGTLDGEPNLIGLDPFPSQWDGPLICGSAEFIPLKSNSVDVSIAATSLDHMFSLDLALDEIERVLVPGGRLIIWDHAGSPVLDVSKRMLSRIRKSKRTLMEFIANGARRVQVYDEGTVLSVPRGFADPFHDPASRHKNWGSNLAKALERRGFTRTHLNPDCGFSTWVLARST